MCEEDDRDLKMKKMVFRFMELPRELRDQVRSIHSHRIGMTGGWGHARDMMIRL